MKISINEKAIKRNKAIAQYSLYGAIGFIGIGLLLTFTNAKNEYTVTYLSYLVLLPAYLLMQVNAMMMNKWGKKPREDEFVTNSLKGLDNRYSLFHYTTPVSHLLVGPGGIWIINAYHQSGIITYDEKKKRYTQKGGGNLLTKIFALDSLSDIERDSKRQRSAFENFFKKEEIHDYPQPVVANVFYHRDTKVDAKNAPDLTTHIEKLKDMIRQKGKTPVMKEEQINKILKKLPETE
jgi:hypothetical protein